MPDIEVEAKYPLPGTVEEWRRRLENLGARSPEVVEQSDEYFSHPARDFVATGEAFRIRTVCDRNALTYKGPLLDSTTKSRREIEVAFAAGDEQARRMRSLLQALGFQPAGVVRKRRACYEVLWNDQCFTLGLDEVDRLGLFLEIEIIAPEDGWTAARDRLLAFAAHIGLPESERRSYLELVLAAS